MMVVCTLGVAFLATGLSACNQSGHEHKREIKPAVKLSTDASRVAADTNQFLQRAEQLMLSSSTQPDQLETQILLPIRQLLLRWNTEIKQSDSVVGDQYTICRGALVSLDSWTRAVQNQTSGQADKQAVFASQKNLCAQAVKDGANQPQPTQPNALTQPKSLTQ
ncbi:MAG: hypothetical protein EOO69_10345 [Moraxellaceae bacterium]|nr:MAG: hypothetical protein EOO69_10345 [Moraxellaceae bacterium]